MASRCDHREVEYDLFLNYANIMKDFFTTIIETALNINQALDSRNNGDLKIKVTRSRDITKNRMGFVASLT